MHLKNYDGFDNIYWMYTNISMYSIFFMENQLKIKTVRFSSRKLFLVTSQFLYNFKYMD